MMTHCIEIVVYKVKNAQTAETQRRGARPHVESLPGFLGWHAVTSVDPLLFTDILTWRSLEEARRRRPGDDGPRLRAVHGRDRRSREHGPLRLVDQPPMSGTCAGVARHVAREPRVAMHLDHHRIGPEAPERW